MSSGVRCMWMRGGSSKGAYFLAEDLPADRGARDALLLGVMGSPDPRQIDGIGGADPLTSKVAVVRKSERPGIDVDYLFLQVFPDKPVVTDAQNCGNILAGVGPFAIERGLVEARDGETAVRIFMENSGEAATAKIRTPDAEVSYAGDAEIAGVPGRHAPIPLMFENTAGSMCGALLPTGNPVDEIEGLGVTMIDNGMPCVVLNASDLGVTGAESREQLDGDDVLKAKLERIRLASGPLMNLGDVAEKSVPKMTLISPPCCGGVVSTRSFIPHRCHASIGVLAAVSVATACLLPEGPAHELAELPDGEIFKVEHPSGSAEVVLLRGPDGSVNSAGTLRTARKLFDGRVFA